MDLTYAKYIAESLVWDPGQQAININMMQIFSSKSTYIYMNKIAWIFGENTIKHLSP